MSVDLAMELLRASRAGGLLVVSDFDGTLAEFVDDPASAEPAAGVMQSLLQLAGCERTTCAIVSSRTTDDLANRLAHPTGLILAGSYGVELLDGHACTARAMSHLQLATPLLQELAARYRGAWVERKPAALVLHTRRVGEPLGGIAQSVARAVLGPLDALHVTAGQDVLEWCAFAADKGRAVDALRSRMNADVVVMLGDSEADERMFARAQGTDVTIRVGAGTTCAKHRVGSPAIAAWVLETLADARRDAMQVMGGTSRTPGSEAETRP